MAAFLFLLALPHSVSGQTLSEAESAYKELFLMRTNDTVNKNDYYAKVLLCARLYQRVLRQTPTASENFPEVQKTLGTLYNSLRSGAGYFSQARADSTALIYAKRAVDIAMMPEMKDLALRTDSSYPNFVLFVASRTYNSAINDVNNVRQIRRAIRYLREYKNVTDSTKHGNVIEPLRQVEQLLATNQKKRPTFEDVYAEVPDFDVFAKEYLQRGLDRWKQKDPYETVAEYKERVNEEKAREKQKELQQRLMDEYVRRFSVDLGINDLQLKPYDADNQSFLIGTPYGDIVLIVPRTNNEARDFAESWSQLQVSDQRFVISDKKLALAGLSFSTPLGKTYKYDNHLALAWNATQVEANFADNLLDMNQLANSDATKNNVRIGVTEVNAGKSDVDINIPRTKQVNSRTFAVIIANEQYTRVSQVPLAKNDGDVFAQYCELTLGLPKENIRQYPNATYGEMLRAMKDIKTIADAFKGINIIFFYAGHGIPNESTRDAFLLPIDADGTDTEVCYPLKRLYNDFSSIPAANVVLFLDACFSGTTGDGKTLMASARGVALKAKQEDPTGNLIVFSAASDDETAYPYEEYHHGMFTYYLLKKLQTSKGGVSLGELGDYIKDNVRKKSVLINNKSQTPTVTVSPALEGQWRKIKLR